MDYQIVAELREMRFIPLHPSLRKLHSLVLEQKETQKHKLKDLYDFLREIMNNIHTRRF